MYANNTGSPVVVPTSKAKDGSSTHRTKSLRIDLLLPSSSFLISRGLFYEYYSYKFIFQEYLIMDILEFVKVFKIELCNNIIFMTFLQKIIDRKFTHGYYKFVNRLVKIISSLTEVF